MCLGVVGKRCGEKLWGKAARDLSYACVFSALGLCYYFLMVSSKFANAWDPAFIVASREQMSNMFRYVSVFESMCMLIKWGNMYCSSNTQRFFGQLFVQLPWCFQREYGDVCVCQSPKASMG